MKSNTSERTTRQRLLAKHPILVRTLEIGEYDNFLFVVDIDFDRLKAGDLGAFDLGFIHYSEYARTRKKGTRRYRVEDFAGWTYAQLLNRLVQIFDERDTYMANYVRRVGWNDMKSRDELVGLFGVGAADTKGMRN